MRKSKLTNQIIKQVRSTFAYKEDEVIKIDTKGLEEFVSQAITQAVEEERTRISKALTGKGYIDFKDIFNNKLTK